MATVTLGLALSGIAQSSIFCDWRSLHAPNVGGSLHPAQFGESRRRSVECRTRVSRASNGSIPARVNELAATSFGRATHTIGGGWSEPVLRAWGVRRALEQLCR
jgi:hypothetical protein